MFSYYGSKSKVVNFYPEPHYGTIIEPFCGSARYALKYHDRKVILCDASFKIIAIWKYIREGRFDNLPVLTQGDDIRDFQHKLSNAEFWLLGLTINFGVATAHYTATKECVERMYNLKSRLRDTSAKIQHWEFIYGDYRRLKNVEATWFIDAPYQVGGGHYEQNQIDYTHLRDWSLGRRGEIIVCENDRATWLPFKPLTVLQGTGNTNTTEMMYHELTSNEATKTTI